MKKRKWFYAELDKPLRIVSKGMLSKQYSDDCADGFILSNVSDEGISGRYIERKEGVEKVLDPFGKVTQRDYIEYCSVKFLLQEGSKTGLELSEYPRSLKGFVREMVEAFGFGGVLSPIQVNPLHWVENISRCVDGVSVDWMSASGINVDNKSLAKVIIKGGAADKSFDSFLSGRQATVEEVRCLITHDGNVYKCRLLKGAVAYLDGDAGKEDMFGIIRNALNASIISSM